MFLTPKKILGIMFSLVITAFLLTGLLVIVGLTQKSQDVKRSKATGETVNLDLVPAKTTVDPNEEFNVIVQATPPQGQQVTAVTGVLDFTNLTLVSVTTGSFFNYPSGTEMLNFGTSCTADSDCRATGISCVSGYCKYANNTAGTVHFDLGAACSVAEPWVCNPATTAGNVATIKFKATGTGTAAISFNSGTVVAAISATTNVGILGASKSITINGGGGGTATVPFKIKFEGITGSGHHNKQVRMIVRSGATEIARVDSIDVTPDSSGIYAGTATVNGLTSGQTYDVLIKDAAHLQKKFTGVTLVTGANPVKDFSAIAELKAGDLAGASLSNPPDNRVDGTDVAKLLQKFDILGTVPVETSEDLDDSGKVDGFDMKLLLNNFDMLGGGDQ